MLTNFHLKTQNFESKCQKNREKSPNSDQFSRKLTILTSQNAKK